MEMKLSGQIQTVIDAVVLAQAEMVDLATTVNGISDHFGPGYNRVLEEIVQILDELGYMRYMAERREAGPATHHSENKAVQD